MTNKMNPLSPLFYSVVSLRNWLYEKKFFKTVRLDIPVISVGNITMGGTGKTPMIDWLVRELSQIGLTPGVVSRNYRGHLNHPDWVRVQPGASAAYGDEAILLKLKNPTLPILSGPQKWASALKLQKEAPEVNVVLIDDGFQHRQLHRNFDIVLLDVSVSVQDYQWPPYGRARESLGSLKRADVIIFTRWEQRNEETVQYLESLMEGRCLVLRAEQCTDRPKQAAGRSIENPELIKTGNALAFCGLGNPGSFLRSLQHLGLNIAQFIKFPDHAVYNDERVRQLLSAGANFDYLVTSEKDMVKLQDWPFKGPPLCVIPMQLKVNGDLEAFREKLSQSMRQLP